MAIRGAPTEQTSIRVEHGELKWVRYEGDGLPTHLVPTWDIRGHALDAHGEACACRPVRDAEDEGTFIHNAFDGRERYEYGTARRH